MNLFEHPQQKGGHDLKMNFEKSISEAAGTVYSEQGATEFEVMLGKCYAYATTPHDALTDEYRVIYEKITGCIEQMECAENVRTVLRLRYYYGHKFVLISQILGRTYQWVYELHKTGVSLLEKHLFL